MRYALPGSLLAHALALGAGLLLLTAPPQPDDAPAAPALWVELITIAPVAADQASVIESDATETLVSSGAEAVAPSPAETVVAIEPEAVEPVEPVTEPVKAEPVAQTAATPVEPMPSQEPEPVAVLSAVSVEPLLADAVAAAPVEMPVAAQPTPQRSETPDLPLAPTPHVLSRPRPSAPTRVAVAKLPATVRPAAPAGNGGRNQADAVAAKPAGGQQGNAGSGGDAETARYPSQVLAKLRRALRYPGAAGGASGEVHVQFAVNAGGQPSGLRVVKSSGNAAIDQAGLETVQRAAPFPPIPPGANRASWDFTIPLAFVRG